MLLPSSTPVDQFIRLEQDHFNAADPGIVRRALSAGQAVEELMAHTMNVAAGSGSKHEALSLLASIVEDLSLKDLGTVRARLVARLEQVMATAQNSEAAKSCDVISSVIGEVGRLAYIRELCAAIQAVGRFGGVREFFQDAIDEVASTVRRCPELISKNDWPVIFDCIAKAEAAQANVVSPHREVYVQALAWLKANIGRIAVESLAARERFHRRQIEECCAVGLRREVDLFESAQFPLGIGIRDEGGCGFVKRGFLVPHSDSGAGIRVVATKTIKLPDPASYRPEDENRVLRSVAEMHAVEIHMHRRAMTKLNPKTPGEGPTLVPPLLRWDRKSMSMECASDGGLGSWLRQFTEPNERLARVLSVDRRIVDMIAKMHDDSDPDTPPIVHRDLKPDNIFIHNGAAWLGDFGFATTNATSSTMAGTPTYSAPEVFCRAPEATDHIATRPADVFSLGCVLYEIYTGRNYLLPTYLKFANDTAKARIEMAAAYYAGPDPSWFQQPHAVGVDKTPVDFAPAWDIIKRMLDIDPEHRPTMEEVVASRWFIRAD